MSGIGGWINSAPGATTARGHIAAMMQRIRGDGIETLPRDDSNAAALGVRSGLVPVSLCSSGALLAAVQGQVHWREAELAKLAAERGTAMALLETYRANGADCLQLLRGPNAIVVIDTAANSGLLAIDRMGVRTLCYANPSRQLIFGSTADSVAAHPQVGRQLSLQAVFDYLYCRVIPSPMTIYQGVYKLLPGECLAFHNGVVTKRFYWRLRYEDQSETPFNVLSERFVSLLREAARRSIGNDRALGAFLSGGTDSSTVTGLLSELTQRPAKTYSIGFDAQGFDETRYARITARHFATEAHEYYVTPNDVVEAIPIIADAYDEPFGNESAVPTYFCARMARADGVRVLLAGDGGDEIFGGNARYAKQKIFELYQTIPGGLRRAIIEPLVLAEFGGLPPLRKLKSYVEQASIPLPDRLESYNFLARTPLQEVLEQEFLAEVDAGHPLQLFREVYQRTSSSSPVNRMMHLDLKFTLADNDLRKVSNMSEVAGVEVRYPLIDEGLVEFSGQLSPSYKVRGLKLRYFFKQALKDFLPAETITKSKHGFGLPFGLWLRNNPPLSDLVRQSLSALERRGIVRPSYVEALLREHRTTHSGYYGSMIWVLMMLERWLVAKQL